ncbi:MAG: helix-turn-helix domain-containing protein [Marmoricola sp.]|nr:helix-turn-helix domain-containing protein [Marmoricola sp.]
MDAPFGDAETPVQERARSTRAELQQARQALTDEFVRRYEVGETVKALAAEFGLHHRTVKARLMEAGVDIRIRERKLTDRQITNAAKLYESGWSTAKIGKKYNVSHNTIRRHLRRRGVKMRPMGRPPRQEG